MARHKWLVVFALLAFGLKWSFADGQAKRPDEPKHIPESALMRAKMASSHKIMEGLVARDFPEIRTGAGELLRICRATEWEAHTDHVYGHYRAELIRQAVKLADAADQSNADAATFAYMNLLTSCINCHDHCRDVLKIAGIKRKSKVVPIPTIDSDENTIQR